VVFARVPSLAVALVFATPLGAAAQTLTETFLSQYRPAAARAAARYWDNRAAKATIRSWHTKTEIGRATEEQELYSTTLVDAHTSGPNARMQIDETFHQVNSLRRTGVLLWSADETFELRPNADGRGYAIASHRWRNAQVVQHEANRMVAPQMLPQLYDDHKSVLGTFDNLGKWPTLPASIEVLAIEPATWKGIACTAVRLRETFLPGNGQKGAAFTYEKTMYFDDRNDWITLAVRYPTEPPPKDVNPRKWAKSSVREVEYAPGPDGYPIPTRSARYAAMLDDSIEFGERVDVHEFVRYLPQPGEFTLEAYGLTRPAETRAAPPQALPAVLEAEPAPAHRGFGGVLVGVGAAVVGLAGWSFWRWRAGVKKKRSQQLLRDASEGSAGW